MRRWMLLTLVMTLTVGIAQLWSATFYVDPNCATAGNTYNPTTRACTGGSASNLTTAPSTSQPGWTTFPNNAFNAMGAGDTVYFRQGTYATPIRIERTSPVHNIPSGTSWTAPTLISAYPINRTCSGFPATCTTTGCRQCYDSTYETVTFRSLGGGSAGDGTIHIKGSGPNPDPFVSTPLVAPPQYLWFEGFRIDLTGNTSGRTFVNVASTGTICHRCVVGGVVSSTGPPRCNNNGTTGTCTGTCLPPNSGVGSPLHADHLTFLNMHTKNNSHSGFSINYRVSDVNLLNVQIENPGATDLHHGVYAGGGMLIDGGYVTGSSGFGYHIYHSVAACDLTDGSINYPGTVISNARMFNNGIAGIVISGQFAGAEVKNCLIYNNVGTGLQWNGFGLSIPFKLYNSTIFGNRQQGIKAAESTRAGGAKIYNTIYDGSLLPNPTVIDLQNNYNACVTCTAPDFFDAANGDFRLASSDAFIVNQGQNLFAAGVTTDFAGNARPSSGAFEIGAFEFGPGGPPSQSFNFSLHDDVDPDETEPILQGSAQAVVLTATTLAGSSAPVTFGVSQGMPPGASVVFAPTSCTPAPTCTTTATLTMGNATPIGGYTVTMSAAGAGLTRTTTFGIDVTCN